MLSMLKKIFRRDHSRLAARRRLLDREALDHAIDRSPVPVILTAVMVWAVATVLLIISGQHQRELLDWVEGQRAPYSIYAETDFKFHDTAATQRERDRVAALVPEYFRMDGKRSNDIVRNFSDFFLFVETALEDSEARRQYSGNQDALPSQLAGKLSPVMLKALGREYTRGSDYANFQTQLRRLLNRGILREADKAARGAGRRIRIIDSGDRISQQSRSVDEFPSPRLAAELLATTLFPQDMNCNMEFRRIAVQLIGKDGNLDMDPESTEEAREEAVSKVNEVIRYRTKGTLLISKGEIFTPSMREMIAAERKALPEAGLSDAYHMMAWSFFLLMTMAFVLYWLNPELARNNRRIIIAGLCVMIALLLNYKTIQFFHYLLMEGRVSNENLVVVAVPIALGPVMVSVLLGFRAALCVGGLVSVVTAMLIMPERSLELALRWTAVASLTALAVRRVSNYRAFFVRTMSWSFIISWLICADLIYRLDGLHQGLYDAAKVVFGSSFTCAALALALIFLFELLFNHSTNMALMVLCDCNHPLLERLKREAPGTMAHSMAVATLSEDAAKAVRANPLIAKAGALFHDIGKLIMPQYFTENNPDSASQHRALNPQMSSMIIRDHVNEGMVLARKYRLCRDIRDIISSHHGDDLVKYFYIKAMGGGSRGDSTQPPVVEDQFRYDGEPPYSREATIVSLADACEAASRSLEQPTPERIRELVEKIFDSRLDSGQLRNSTLSLAELEMVRESFITTLTGTCHGRVAYPEEGEKKDADALPVAESPASEPAEK